MNETLHTMLADFESHQLHVILVPLNPRLRGYNEGGCRRVAADRNATWYRQLCARHPSSRGVRRGGFDTRIRRATILSVLRRLCAGLPSRSKYAPEIMALARGRAA